MLPLDFKPTLILSDDQAALLRGYLATNETIYLHLLGDRLIDDGHPVFGELLLRGVERGVIHSRFRWGTKCKPLASLFDAVHYVYPNYPYSEGVTRVRCINVSIACDDETFSVSIPATGDEIASLIEATETVKPRSVLAHELAGLRSGEVKTWLDYLSDATVN